MYKRQVVAAATAAAAAEGAAAAAVAAAAARESEDERPQTQELLAATTNRRFSTAEKLRLPWIVPAGENFWFYQVLSNLKIKLYTSYAFALLLLSGSNRHKTIC